MATVRATLRGGPHKSLALKGRIALRINGEAG
ncbi:hypothetical protein Sinac_1884 [Singulisphaera acidiphila DSM 18658]|uniref:Uncharacterized protein n=1 Tax=Singulisphaera acidiphila (strain ATCC BAA-1392 / DSM 18658 / VKM B-2454 / MOB10) TaxID=886293 RepID=L0DC46_SINAD|nr:hypothetical protein Sinac_1884 [Singulisphaera acidiphila DSM 18658]